MAKQLKAIHCPKCGSGKKQLLEKEHYKCSNCETTYFLDNDDVNVLINYTSNQKVKPNKNKNLALVALILGFGVIMFSTTLIPRSKNTIDTSEKGKRYREQTNFINAYTASDHKTPILIFKINRDINNIEGRDTEELYIRLFDPIKGNILSDYLVSDIESNPRVEIKRFSNGELFILVENSKRIFKVNEQLNTVEDVTAGLLGAIPELSSGIAKLGFIHRSNNGFEVVSNIGNEYTYFPLVDKLYTKEDMNEIRDSDGTFSAEITESIHYIFTEKSGDFPEKEIQLIKYWYSGNTGYPESPIYTPKWEQRWDNKVQLFRSSQIKRFIDLTPDRLYFKPEIMGYDQENIYITGLPNADESGSKFLQSLDASSNVNWTFIPKYKTYKFDTDFAVFENGVVCTYFNWGAPERLNFLNIIDKNGKVVKELDLDKLF